MIYHLTEPARWVRSLEEGVHTGSSRGIELADEGFIHCSTAEQWPTVRQLFYADVEPLLLLHIDESKVGAEVVYEQLGDAPAAFPHIYGPLPLAAVVRVEELNSR
jgi:glutathione S-transferase